MEQLSVFGDEGQHLNLPANLLQYIPCIFNSNESKHFMKAFIEQIPWEQKQITMYGKQLLTPRLTSWHGDAHKAYAYSGNKFNPLPWTPELLKIKHKIEPLAGVLFNSVLLNYYRDGNDSVAWHSDDETELGGQPVIASVSFGQPRRFDVRNKTDKNIKYAIMLEEGSMLLMKGDLQQKWEHRIAKSTLPMNSRVNLTFRVIV